MIKYIALFFLYLPALVFSAGDNTDYFTNETRDSCYSKPMSPAVQNCMNFLSEKRKNEYENEFHDFENKITASKNEFNNYIDFIRSIKIAKKNWDTYIKNECMAIALLDIKESYAYYTDYHSCLVRGYEDRIKYYQKYQL